MYKTKGLIKSRKAITIGELRGFIEDRRILVSYFVIDNKNKRYLKF